MDDLTLTAQCSAARAMQAFASGLLPQLTKIDQLRSLDEMHNAIDQLMALLGECSGAKRVYLFDRLDDDPDIFCNTYEWCAPGVTPQIGMLQTLNVADMPVWLAAFERGETIVIRNLEDVKDTMPREYAILKPQDIQVELAVPVRNRTVLKGFIGLDDPPANLSELFHQQLSFIGAHLSTARENLRMLTLQEETLRTMEQERQMLWVLSEDSTSVFRVDLETDQAEVVKLALKTNVSSLIYPQDDTPLCYTAEMRKFYEKFVVLESAPTLLEDFSPANLLATLETEEHICRRFQMVPNAMGQRYFEVRASKLPNTKSVLLNFRYIDAIVEEERRHQRELEAAEEAKRANEAKSDFLSRMSHDIRTPMNVIMGFTNLATQHLNEPDLLRDYLDKIRISGKNLEQLINDVLDISRIEKGEFLLTPQPIDLTDLLDYYEKTVLASSLTREKHLTALCPRHELPHKYLLADQLRLGQVYMNLLSNAIKYTPEGGTIRFEVYEEALDDPSHIRLVSIISDTGIGMTPEFMRVMYSEFSRAIDTRVNKVRGSGLGLAIVRKIVDLMGGSITADSTPGQGTTFRVDLDLPIVTEQDATNHAPAKPKQALTLPDRPIRLLIAEDNDLNYEIEAAQLEPKGLRCTRAMDGVNAVSCFSSAPPGTFDAILMDMQMPRMSGPEAAKTIRALPRADAKTIPILAVTANAYQEDVQLCLAAGMNAHLAKPLDVDHVLATLAEQLHFAPQP